MPRHLTGALAGVTATALMTVALSAMYRRLPAEQRYPLPPREITMEVASRAGVAESLSEEKRVEATLLAHFGFGAAAGALYPSIAGRAQSPLLGGIGYGLAIWAVSYLGVLPGLRVLKMATAHPARRSLAMILAHVVWGGAAGVVADGLERSSATFLREGEHRDAVRRDGEIER